MSASGEAPDPCRRGFRAGLHWLAVRMTMNWKTVAFVALVGFGLLQHLQDRPVSRGEGLLAPATPRQVDIDDVVLAHKGYTVRALASFDIEARVLSRELYSLDREADLAPVDLVLGWGRMSDSVILDKVSISQGKRFYHWRVSEFPIPREEIERSSANMHMIPADPVIAADLKRVRPGQVVQVAGWLVEAKSSDGWVWRSSLSRNDTGAGACELIYVKSLRIL